MSDTQTRYAAIGWSAEDVQTLWPEMSEPEAAAFLGRNERHIRDRLVEEGWEVMRSLRAFEEAA